MRETFSCTIYNLTCGVNGKGILLVLVVRQAKTALYMGQRCGKVANCRDRTRNPLIPKRCTNHCTTGPHLLGLQKVILSLYVLHYCGRRSRLEASLACLIFLSAPRGDGACLLLTIPCEVVLVEACLIREVVVTKQTVVSVV